MFEKSEIYVEFCPQKVLKYSSYIFFSPKGAKKSQPKKYEVRTITVQIYITLGCKTNIYESEAMAQLFEKSGHTVVPNGCADIIVVNTCTVTGTGASKSIKLIRRARRENPERGTRGHGLSCTDRGGQAQSGGKHRRSYRNIGQT